MVAIVASYTAAVKYVASVRSSHKLLAGLEIPSLSIAVLGGKGGSGKTTTSRLIARGLGLLEIPTWVIITDARPEDVHGEHELRLFRSIDGTSPDKLKKALDQVAAIRAKGTPLVVVIDGAASRGNEADLALARLSDVVLFPTRFSNTDLAVLFKTLPLDQWQEMAEKLHILRTCWPTKANELSFAERKFSEFWEKAEFGLGDVNLPVPLPDWPLVNLLNETDAEMRAAAEAADAGTAEGKAWARNMKRLDGLCRYAALVALSAAGIIEMPEYATMAGFVEKTVEAEEV